MEVLQQPVMPAATAATVMLDHMQHAEDRQPLAKAAARASAFAAPGIGDSPSALRSPARPVRVDPAAYRPTAAGAAASPLFRRVPSPYTYTWDPGSRPREMPHGIELTTAPSLNGTPTSSTFSTPRSARRPRGNAAARAADSCGGRPGDSTATASSSATPEGKQTPPSARTTIPVSPATATADTGSSSSTAADGGTRPPSPSAYSAGTSYCHPWPKMKSLREILSWRPPPVYKLLPFKPTLAQAIAVMIELAAKTLAMLYCGLLVHLYVTTYVVASVTFLLKQAPPIIIATAKGAASAAKAAATGGYAAAKAAAAVAAEGTHIAVELTKLAASEGTHIAVELTKAAAAEGTYIAAQLTKAATSTARGYMNRASLVINYIDPFCPSWNQLPIIGRFVKPKLTPEQELAAQEARLQAERTQARLDREVVEALEERRNYQEQCRDQRRTEQMHEAAPEKRLALFNQFLAEDEAEEELRNPDTRDPETKARDAERIRALEAETHRNTDLNTVVPAPATVCETKKKQQRNGSTRKAHRKRKKHHKGSTSAKSGSQKKSSLSMPCKHVRFSKTASFCLLPPSSSDLGHEADDDTDGGASVVLAHQADDGSDNNTCCSSPASFDLLSCAVVSAPIQAAI
ncbi:hypothetical protein HDU87_006715 [Geranomyces variabilis]|uniref:Uncharacterized protein n=1 Tax=Geranomyces variabilis TaxID=109894 RepID=A0AAD5XTS9_9FUNG|nr:hypothetical protein HDU87_006715 [Geranomyces variabilis]